ncbi:chromo (chrromatin organization modifier) domain-containing protein, partial [Cystoisospora suis]
MKVLRKIARRFKGDGFIFLEKAKKVAGFFLSGPICLLNSFPSVFRRRCPRKSPPSVKTIPSTHQLCTRWRLPTPSSLGLSKTAQLRREKKKRFYSGIARAESRKEDNNPRRVPFFWVLLLVLVYILFFDDVGEGVFSTSAYGLALQHKSRISSFSMLPENINTDTPFQRQRFSLLTSPLRSPTPSPPLSPFSRLFSSSSPLSQRSSSSATSYTSNSRSREDYSTLTRLTRKNLKKLFSADFSSALPNSLIRKTQPKDTTDLLPLNLSVNSPTMRQDEKEDGMGGPLATSSSISFAPSHSLSVKTSSKGEEKLLDQQQQEHTRQREGGHMIAKERSHDSNERKGDGEENTFSAHGRAPLSSSLGDRVFLENPDEVSPDQSLITYITGFGPFANIKNNPTACVVMHLHDVLLHYLKQSEDTNEPQQSVDLSLPSFPFTKFPRNSTKGTESDSLFLSSPSSLCSTLPSSSSHPYEKESRCTYTPVISPLLTQEELEASCSVEGSSSSSAFSPDDGFSSSTQKAEDSASTKVPGHNSFSFSSSSSEKNLDGGDVPSPPPLHTSARTRESLSETQHTSLLALSPPDNEQSPLASLSPPTPFLSSSPANISICGAQVLHVSARAVDEAVPRIVASLTSLSSSTDDMKSTKKKKETETKQAEVQAKDSTVEPLAPVEKNHKRDENGDRSEEGRTFLQEPLIDSRDDRSGSMDQLGEREEEDDSGIVHLHLPLPKFLSRHTTSADEVVAPHSLSSSSSLDVSEETYGGPTSPDSQGAHLYLPRTGKKDGNLHRTRKLLLHLGLDAKAKTFNLEERAVNEANFRGQPDQQDYIAKGEKIEAEGPGCLSTSLPLDVICERMQAKGFSCRTSTDAGRFVCNYTYYKSLFEARRRGDADVFVLFVHGLCFSFALSFLLAA